MPRIDRTHCPLDIQLAVALRQLGHEPNIIADLVAIAQRGRCVGKALNDALDKLAARFGCARADLRRDHNPPLAARRKWRSKETGKVIRYDPPEHSPEHMEWRPQPPEHERSHHVKTYVRGDRGQYSDIVLIKRRRRREQPQKPKRTILRSAKPWPKGRKIHGRSQWPKKKLGCMNWTKMNGAT